MTTAHQSSRDETSACQACGQAGDESTSPLVSVTTRNQKIVYARCPVCGLLRVNPLPAPEVLAGYYDAEYYGLGETKFAGWMDAIRGLCLRRRAARVRPLVQPSKIRVLDIGAGDGRFLGAMHAAGCESWGTELAGPAFERASQVPGLQMVAGDVTEAGFEPGSFDIITIWHVLEHVTAPARTIRCCHDLLREGGVLVIEVPNASSWQTRLSQGYAFHLDPPRHLYQFTPAALETMLSRADFETIRCETASLEMGVIGALQSGLNHIIRPRDLLYDMLRTRNKCEGSAGAKLASLLLAAVLTPAALLFTLLETACSHGPVLRIFCRKGAAPKIEAHPDADRP